MSNHACNYLCSQGLHYAQRALDTDDPEEMRQFCEETLEILENNGY